MTQKQNTMQLTNKQTNCCTKKMTLEEFKITLEFLNVSTFGRDDWVKKKYKTYLETDQIPLK